jgi:cation:H+ antiporter
MSGWTVVGFVAGLVGLIGGAELLVRGGTTLATRFGIPPVIVGLTVVAFGTGAPELAIGAGAALSGTTSLALGNVVGSNIANVLLVLGAAAAVRSLAVNQQVLRVDIPLLALISVGVATLSLTGTISRVEGLCS